MGNSERYQDIGHKRNVSHFANIVRIAKSDGEVSTEEMELLSKVAEKYNISQEQFEEILKDPDRIPSLARLEFDERVERLYELLQMVEADRRIEKSEVNTMRKIVNGLAFPFNEVDRIVMQSLKTDLEITDLNRFKRDMYKLLKVNP
jgi:uncharacterized tellurite resistance protein B-like protein